MSDIDPVEFGELKGRMAGLEVANKRLEVQIGILGDKVDDLIALANQGKGGIWVFRTVYVTAGGMAAYFLPKLLRAIGF